MDSLGVLLGYIIKPNTADYVLKQQNGTKPESREANNFRERDSVQNITN